MKSRLALVTLGFLLFAGNAFAGDAKEVPLNFDTQVIKIFEAVLAPGAPKFEGKAPHDIPFPAKAIDANERKVFERILGKFRKHEMMLKNAVYRTDMGAIRLTWADDANIDVVKIGYKTGKDPVLGNSVYADKRQVISVKIMYLTDKGDYDYLHLENMEMNPDYKSAGAPPIPERPTYHYNILDRLPNEQCGFCHVLSQNDGSPKGVFFPRYQETYKQTPIKSGLLFRAEHFTRKPAAQAQKLGLAKMQEDFLYQKIDGASGNSSDENTRFIRALIEMPQLVEVMARDNGQSTCVAVSFGEVADKYGFGRNDYVCADNKAERLYVRLTNAMLTNNKGAKEYSDPYFEKY